MSKEIDVEWKSSIVIDGVSYCPDHLDRAKYALFLTSFLNSQDLSKPYVLNLNSGWGTGKTYFLKRWAEDLKRRHPVVYIDAWKDDHSDDPFMTVVSAIISSLRELTDKPEDSFLSKSCENGWSLLKAMGPMMVGAAAKKYLGKDLDELLSFDEENSPDIHKEVGDAAAKMAQFLISAHEKKSASVKALKLDILGWIGSVVGQGSGISKPTFVIIDELDRCRPSYAVEMLEAIKHIFDIPGVFFIIATDTEQLQHAIKVVYGGGFDAQTYLSRFFDSRFSLRQPSLRGLIETHCNINVLSKEYCLGHQISIWPKTEDQLSNVVSIIDTFNLSPRIAIQIVNRIISTISYMRRGNCFDIVYLTILHCMRASDFDTFNKISGIAPLGNMEIVFKGKGYVNSRRTINLQCDVIRRVLLDITLDKYFKSIFVYVSNVFDDVGMVNSNLRSGGYQLIVKELESGVDRNRGVDFSLEVFHLKQMQADYLENNLHNKNKKYYLDLVELSASFD